MTDQSIAEISELLDTFNLDEIQTIVENQILKNNISLVGASAPDQFHPIYYKYRAIMEENDNEDILKEIRTRFINICEVFLSAIEKKYSIHVDEGWLDSHYNDIPNLTMALYDFFVVNHGSNVEEALYGYIVSHVDELYAAFEGHKQKKDATTLSNKKEFSSEFAIILSNMYDVCAYIYDNGFKYAKDFFDCTNKDYLYGALIASMYEEGTLCGVFPDNDDDAAPVETDFLDRLSDMFKEDVSYKGILCYRICDKVRKHAAAVDMGEIDI